MVLAGAVAAATGIALGAVEEREFERGEHKARPLVSVRGRDVVVVHCVHGDIGGPSANDRLVRLWFFIATVKDAGARSVTALVPYLPYSRKDRRTKARDPLGSRYVAQHFEAAGTDRIMTLEPHNVSAFENSFRIEAIALPAAPLIAEWACKLSSSAPLVVVSPDVGGAKRAQQLREVLSARIGDGVGLAFVEKRRSGAVLSGELLVGEVQGCRCLLVDDLVSSGATLGRAAAACRKAGALEVSAAVAHALLSPSAATTLREARLDHFVVTDSVPVPPLLAGRLPIAVLGLGRYLGQALRSLWRDGSLSELIGME
jgi:ribose-phosphate pyrophosphokinase